MQSDQERPAKERGIRCHKVVEDFLRSPCSPEDISRLNESLAVEGVAANAIAWFQNYWRNCAISDDCARQWLRLTRIETRAQ